MKVDLYNNKIEKGKDQIEISEKVWAAKYNTDLITQVISVARSNKRSGTAHAKSRGQVSGGGRKPWKQKGTGRARVGSIRSPLWVGGGVTFVPSFRNWTKKISKRMKSQALSSLLSKRLEDEVLLFANLEAGLERDTFANEKSVLIVTESKDIYLNLRNLPGVTCIRPQEITAFDVISARSIIIDSAGVAHVESRFTNKK